MRFLRTFGLVALLAGVFAAGAWALAFNDSDFAPQTAIVGQPYSFQYTARGGCPPYSFRVQSGSLPPGLSLSSSGLISGTPTTPGSWGFWIELSDSSCGANLPPSLPSQRSFQIDVLPKLTITTASLPVVVPGVAYSQKLTFDGGGSPTWSLAPGAPALPAGLTLASDGTLSGTTTAPVGPYRLQAQIVDGVRSDTANNLYLYVSKPISIAQVGAQTGEVSVPIKPIALAATDGIPDSARHYGWKVTSTGPLPSGLVLDPGTGAISGTPTAPGTFPVTITATDTIAQTASVSITFAIAEELQVTAPVITPVFVGQQFAARWQVTGGAKPLSWTHDVALPLGLRFNSKTGLVVGKPRVPGVTRVRFTVTDKLGVTSTKTLKIVVKRHPKKSK